MIRNLALATLASMALLPAVFAASTTTCSGSTCTVSNDNSDFTVTYNRDEVGLFGTPGAESPVMLSNNTIFFVPDAFLARSLNGDNPPNVSETLNLTLTATTLNFSFDSFFLQETGDYILDGPGAEVSASGEMRVRDVENPIVEFQDSFFFSDSGDLGSQPQNWSGSTTIDATDGWFGTENQVHLTLQNILTADTMAMFEEAFIQKKFSGIEISVNPVPIPAAGWLMGSALLGLFGLRRRQA
ncbi:MAG: VPLPA-CTERM sorting domain-containing protein [Gammaproteobacteria bacterium]|nr:VPLPA-CTERM sorting domain-containing protein [Gammaproteobacteria bacterium]NNF62059.1 hypothetical protein [Gammaproteobacteria bacterium]NNM20670.1 hypothetical protein [Gammaproteobacteria bacterium]